MDNTLMVITIISLIILVICIFSYKDMNFSYLSNLVNKTIEKMNSEEIITDFEKIIQSENQRVTLNNGNTSDNKKINEKFSSLNMNSNYNNNTELNNVKGWEIYSQGPFNEMKTMPPNPVFYVKPLYRKPYNYPFGYEQSYPINHYSNFKN